MLLPFCVVIFEIFALVTSHKGDLDGNDLESTTWAFANTHKVGTLDEVNADIPAGDKDGLYYFVITLFVFATVSSTILTGSFIVLSVLLWWHFKSMKFFWFLTQLTLTVFVVATLNLIINVPATLFSLITKDFVTSDAFLVMSYVIDMCHYTILFSNLVIAVQRFFVFFLRHLTDRVFDSPAIFVWLAFVWAAPVLIVFLMAFNKCRYRYTKLKEHYEFYCTPVTTIVNLPPPTGMVALEMILQFLIPILIIVIYILIITKIVIMKKSLINKTEVSILKQAFLVFLLFQISSLVFIFSQSFTFGTATAFIIKRVINTTELLAGAATPCYFFFTSKDVRKLLSTRVSAVSSQNNSQAAARRQTMRSL